jgi:hypothetical protein
MKINDTRHINISLNFKVLLRPNVYLNTTKQKYVMKCQDDFVVDLSTGELYDYDDMGEDSFQSLNATVEIH